MDHRGLGLLLLASFFLPACPTSSERPPDGSLSDASTGFPPELCGLVMCGGATFCCLATGECETSMEACRAALPPPGPTDPGTRCGSSADCPPDSFCDAAGGREERCLSAGFCRPRGGTCTGSSPVCGCDGRTYDSPCAASRAGVRRNSNAACGEMTDFGD